MQLQLSNISYEDYKYLFMEFYDRMNAVSAGRAIEDWLMDIKEPQRSAIDRECYDIRVCTSKLLKRQIAEAIDCQPESPTWIAVRRISNDSNVLDDSAMRPTRQISYEPVIPDSFVRVRNVLRSIVEDRNFLNVCELFPYSCDESGDLWIQTE